MITGKHATTNTSAQTKTMAVNTAKAPLTKSVPTKAVVLVRFSAQSFSMSFGVGL